MDGVGSSFGQLIARVRCGDAHAAEELVLRYESDLRIIARVRLTDPRLRRVLDSMDICQSIMAKFFRGAAAGQFDLDTPEQLMKLLATMVRNKVTDHARRARRSCRDTRRELAASVDELPIAGNVATPSQVLARRELLQAIQQQLSDEERLIAELRAQSIEWSEIARRLGGSADAIRKKHARAMDRAAQSIELDGGARG